jgi:hypothetical protein
VQRSTELRTERVEMDETAERFIQKAVNRGEINLAANRRQAGNQREYLLKERAARG